MKHLNFIVVGCGNRGSSLTSDVVIGLDEVTVIGLCDHYKDKAETLAGKINEKAGYTPEVFTDHNEMFAAMKGKADAVLVSCSWEGHVAVACDAMKAGIAVAMEVGGAQSEEECWKLVDTYEATKTPFMFLENCCFDRDEMLATAVARRGIFGRIMYAHGAYSHDIRDEVGYGKQNRHYRLYHYLNRNCENYPTHELGPIAKVLGINRGNRMVSLVSMASAAAGMHQYILNEQPNLDHLLDAEFKQGDVVDTLIKCEDGAMISLRLDTTLPGYYSREFTLKGTRGMFNHDTNTAMVDGQPKELKHKDNAYEAYYDFLPPIWKNVTPEILQKGHGGMDYFQFEQFCADLREGRDMTIDVYDAAAWMAVTYLSEKSIAEGSIPVAVPDFTRGAYKTRPTYDVTDLGLDKDKT